MPQVHDPSRLRVARESRQLRDAPYHCAGVLAWALNYATHPGVLRSDEEHVRSSRIARAIRARLTRWDLWRYLEEYSNGALYQKSR